MHAIRKRKNGLILGVGYKIGGDERQEIVRIPWGTVNRHVYALGSTGVGKTILLRNIVYQLIKEGYGVLGIDLKGENEIMNDKWRACHETGRQEDYIYFSPILSDKFMTNTAQWNPLINGDANVVASRLMDAFANSNPAAEFYEKTKFDILFACVSCMKEIGKVFTLKDLLFAMSSIEGMKKLYLMNQRGKSEGKKALANVINDWETNPKIFITYIKGSKVSTQEMALGLPGTICNAVQPTLDLTDVIEKNKVVYCYLPTMYAKHAMRGIGKMLLSELKNVFANIQAFSSKTAKFAIVVDEFEELIFPAVKDLFNKARSAGVSLIVAHQTIADVNYETGSAEFGKSLIDNTANKLVMPLKSKESAKALADIIGEYMPIPVLHRWIQQKHIVPPEILMGKSAIYDNGLDVGEMIAKIDGEVYRVRVPYPEARESIVIGRDIPMPTHAYKAFDYGEPLDLENATR